MAANYSLISELTRENETSRIKVRVSRVWDAVNPKKNRELISTDMVLIDEKGAYVHATIRSNIAHQFRGVFVEGEVYFIENFLVVDNRARFRVVSDSKIMLQLQRQTIFTQITNVDSEFPSHRFDIVEFDQLEGRKGQDYVLTDVVGRVVGNSKLQQKHIYGRDVECITLELEDLWKKKVKITLWDTNAGDYIRQKEMLANQTMIGVFTSNMVKEFMNATTLTSTTATKVFWNLEIDAIIELKDQPRPIGDEGGIKSLEVHGYKIDKDVMLSKKKTVAELLDITATDFQSGIDYFCKARIFAINKDVKWHYNSCPRCKTLLKESDTKFWCNRCKKMMDDAVPRYRLELQVQDGTEYTNFIVFDEVAEKLIGLPITSLYDLEDKKQKAGEDRELPSLIRNLEGASHVFRVKLTDYNRTARRQSFTASKVWDGYILDDEHEFNEKNTENVTDEGTSNKGKGKGKEIAHERSENGEAVGTGDSRPKKKRRLVLEPQTNKGDSGTELLDPNEEHSIPGSEYKPKQKRRIILSDDEEEEDTMPTEK